MNVMTKTRFEVVPLSRHIGAEIRGFDLRQKPDEDTVKAIYQAWLDHLVIVFPGQSLSQEDLVRVTGYFGEQGMPRRPPKFFPKGTEAFGQCVHPVFRTHEDTGRKAVYVNRLMTVGVVDMPPEKSGPLLNAVFDHAEKREFVYEHEWRVGDLLLWDNRCSSHARTDFPSTERRLMLRTTVQGSVRPY